MNNAYTPTHVHQAPLTPQVPSRSLDRCNSQPLNQVAERPPFINQAESLDLGSSEPRLIARQAKVKPGDFDYDLSQLIYCPNEVQWALFSKLDQSCLENFFEAIEKQVLLGMAAISSGEPISDTTQACKDLLAMALMSFSQDIHFNKTIYKILQCAKRLGINSFFERSPLLCIDFSSATLQDVSYAKLKDLLEGTSYGFKKIILRALKEETLVFSAQPFQKLKRIEIADTESLREFKLGGDSDASCLKTLGFQEQTKIKTIDLERAPNLEDLWIDNASVVEELKLSKNKTIRDCSIDEKYTFSQKKDGIYLFLQEFGGHGGIQELKRLLENYRNGNQGIERTKILCAFLDHNVKRLLGLLSISLEEFLESWTVTETFNHSHFTSEDAEILIKGLINGSFRIISDVEFV